MYSWRAEVRIDTKAVVSQDAAPSAPSPGPESSPQQESRSSSPAAASAQGSGCVTLQRLAGNHVTVQTAGADVNLGVCYCDALNVASGGGDISASHLNCQGASGRVLLSSDGGAVRIGGLDGTAEIDSGDGCMSLQVGTSCIAIRSISYIAAHALRSLHASWHAVQHQTEQHGHKCQTRKPGMQITGKAEQVNCRAAGGSIEAHIAPTLRCNVHASDSRGAITDDGSFRDTSVSLVDNAIQSSQGSADDVAPARTSQPHDLRARRNGVGHGKTVAAVIRLTSERGSVRLAPRTWRMSVQQSMRNQRAQA